MRPSLVVIPSPALDGHSGIGQAYEPALVQALVPEPTVEALSVRILHRFPGLDEVQCYAALVRPLIQDLAGELRTVVAHDTCWQSSRQCEPI